jgi:hypothetical protein
MQINESLRNYKGNSAVHQAQVFQFLTSGETGEGVCEEYKVPERQFSGIRQARQDFLNIINFVVNSEKFYSFKGFDPF